MNREELKKELENILYVLADISWKDGNKGDNGDTQLAILRATTQVESLFDQYSNSRVTEKLELLLDKIPLTNGSHLVQEPEKIYESFRTMLLAELEQSKEK